MSEQGLKIETIKTEDLERVLNFLREFFFIDEPLCKSSNLINENNPRSKELEEYCLKTCKSNVSLKATIGNEIVGVCLNDFIVKGFIDHLDESECEEKNWDKISKCLNFLAKKADVFSHYPQCDKAIYAKILSVNESLRGRGIGKALLDKTREMGKENGCGFMVVDCSSHFTAKAVKRLGFNCIFSVNYSDYKVDGMPVFEPEPPHAAMNTYVQAL